MTWRAILSAPVGPVETLSPISPQSPKRASGALTAAAVAVEPFSPESPESPKRAGASSFGDIGNIGEKPWSPAAPVLPTEPEATPNPWPALYADWFRGLSEPRALVALDREQVRAAVAAGVVSRDLARACVLLAYRSPLGVRGLMAIPRARYDGLAVAAILAEADTLEVAHV